MNYSLIFSRNDSGCIGINGELLCHLSDDLKQFKQITTSQPNNVIIMGYNTWVSLPRKPLPGRLNLVLSKNHTIDESESVVCKSSLEEAETYLETYDHGEVFLIGGAQLLDYVLTHRYNQINRIYETLVQVNPEHRTDDQISKICIEDYMSLLHGLQGGDFTTLFCERKEGNGQVYREEKPRKINYLFTLYQVKDESCENEREYLRLLQDVKEHGNHRGTRNSNVISTFGKSMRFDLRKGFPLLTTKKMGFKTILRELLWFLNGSTDNRLLQEKNIHIWDKNAEEYSLRSGYEKGDLGPIYGFQWRHFGAKYQGCHESYDSKGIDQIQWLLNEIKENPQSRRLLFSAWNPVDIPSMALPPCHVLVQFYIEGNYMDAQLYQRSGDMFLGVPFNIASYSLLLMIMCKLSGYKPRYFHHILGDAHIYENQYEVVNQQLRRSIYSSPKVIIRDVTSLEELSESDFELQDYKSHRPLRAEMIA